MKYTYEIGEQCWYMMGNTLCEGHVVFKFTVPNHFAEFYVIEPADDMAFHFETRDALLMTDDPEKSIPFFQRAQAI